MPRQTPADLADEVRAEGGPWSLHGARFAPVLGKEPASFGVSIVLHDGAVTGEVALDRRPLREARTAAEALERSGYEILRVDSRPFHARRRIRGLRELDAEVCRLEDLSRDRTAFRSFPPRIQREAGNPSGSGSVSMPVFDRLRRQHGWEPEWISTGRIGPAPFVDAPGWTTAAWCWFIDDGDARRILLLVQLFLKPPSRPAVDKGLARLTRAVRKLLEPLGYAVVTRRGPKTPELAVLHRKVRTLSGARRERGRLDRVLFGD